MYLGIDIGGTKTLLALFSSKGRITRHLKFPTDQNPTKFFKTLEKSLHTLLPARTRRLPTITSVTVAIPGPVNPSFKTPPFVEGIPLGYGNLAWQNFDFTSHIESCIKNLFKSNRVKLSTSAPQMSIHGETQSCCPIFLRNDASLATLAEAQNYKGKTIYLTYSTGIGGGIIENGVLSRKSDYFEPGHTTYIWGGERLEYEDIASASAIGKAYTQKFASPGRPIQVTDLRGRSAYQDIALRVSTGLAGIIKTERPDRIIIGGALGVQLKNFRKYLTPLLAVSLRCSLDELPPLLAAKTPFDSTICGCYLYGRSQD